MENGTRGRYLVGILGGLLLAASAALGQTQTTPPVPSGQQIWAASEREIASVTARIAFPRIVGWLTAYRTQEFTRHGEGLDNAIQYNSPDGAIIATAYVYFPGLPHAGLAAFATDQAIRRGSEASLTGGEARIVAAGGVPDVAIRQDYAGYRGDVASSAAHIKAERWIVKLRVSGPEPRRAEVVAAMDALLAGIRFGVASPPRPAILPNVRDCAPNFGATAARQLPNPTGPESAAHAFLGTFDGGGIAATNERGVREDLPSRVPAELCLSSRWPIGLSTASILRGTPGEALSVDGRSMLVATLGDSGVMIEVVHAANLERYWLLVHEIGQTSFVRSYDGVPSDEQVRLIVEELIAGRLRPTMRVVLRPDGRHQMYLPGAQPEPPRPR